MSDPQAATVTDPLLAVRAITDVIVGALMEDGRFSGPTLVYEVPGRVAAYDVGFSDATEAVGLPITITVRIPS